MRRELLRSQATGELRPDRATEDCWLLRQRLRLPPQSGARPPVDNYWDNPRHNAVDQLFRLRRIAAISASSSLATRSASTVRTA